MKTLSSNNLERGRGAGGLDPAVMTRSQVKDSASTSASPDRSTLTVENLNLSSSSGEARNACIMQGKSFIKLQSYANLPGDFWEFQVEVKTRNHCYIVLFIARNLLSANIYRTELVRASEQSWGDTEHINNFIYLYLPMRWHWLLCWLHLLAEWDRVQQLRLAFDLRQSLEMKGCALCRMNADIVKFGKLKKNKNCLLSTEFHIYLTISPRDTCSTQFSSDRKLPENKVGTSGGKWNAFEK